MINNKDKIDNYFNDSLADYEASPSANVWKNISLLFFGSGPGRPALFWSLLAGGLIIALTATTLLMPWPGIEETGQAEVATEALLAEDSRVEIEPSEKILAEAVPAETPLDEETMVLSVPAETPLDEETMVLSVPAEAAPSEIQPLNTDPASYGTFPANAATRQNETAFYLSALTWGDVVLPETRNQDQSITFRDGPEAPDFDFSMEDDYARRADLGFGIHFAPGVIFYDPNPNKNSYTLDATANYKVSRFMVEAGVGVNKSQDVGSYKVLYNSYDSVGYFREVNSFSFAQDNADSIIYQYSTKTVYDSVPHVSISEKNNSYTYFIIPVSFGYRIFNKGRVLSYAKVGGIYSLLVDKDEPTVDLEEADEGLVTIERTVPVRTPSNLMFTASLSFGILLSDKVVLSLEPYYWQYLNNIYSPQEGYSPKKPYIIGIRAGIDFNF